MARYNTKQRENILEYIHNNKDKHISVDDVVFYLQSINSKVGKTTVYRYMDILEKEGKVRKFIGTQSACYQYIDDDGKCAQHYHFMCTSCDNLYHMECSLLDEIKGHVKKNHNFILNNSKTVFYGVCEKCSKKV